MRSNDRERVRVEVGSRVVSAFHSDSISGGLPLENLLNDTLYRERKRLEKDPPSSQRTQDLQFWNEVGRRLAHASEQELLVLLRRATERYVNEIIGHLNEIFYEVTTSMAPLGLGAVLNGLSPRRLLQGATGLPGVEESILLDGDVETLQKLQNKGSVILAPTHSSHVDSIAVGWALHHLGIPPFLYGAGLNLFSNPFMGFFMNNLGAYRVDRKKNNVLYKTVLKAYSVVALEKGYNNLFFPGGTRSRSGAIERHLKLGLLGTGIEAYVRRLRMGKARPHVYVVPCTISYPLVLEAETLIDDFLKETGKARYIITDDEFSRPRRVFTFLRNIVRHDSRIRIRFCGALDVFGNKVNGDGESIDSRGRVIDTSKYVLVDGVPRLEPSRDREYTRELGTAITGAFARGNTVLSTHVLAFATFRELQDSNPDLDLYRLLRTGGNGEGLPVTRIYELVETVCRLLTERDDLARLSPALVDVDPRELVIDALRAFGSYHTHPVLERRGDRLFAGDMNLLFYYHNRLSGYELEKVLLPMTSGRSL